MELLAPETLVNVFVNLPHVGALVASRVCRYWHEIIDCHVIEKVIIPPMLQSIKCGPYEIILKLADEIKYRRIALKHVIEYVCSYGDMGLFKWCHAYFKGFTLDACTTHGWYGKNLDVIIGLNKIHKIQPTWTQLCGLDRPGHDLYYLSIDHYEPKLFTKLLASKDLQIDWWAVLAQIPFNNDVAFMWGRNRLTTNGVIRVKLIFAKIILESRASIADMFVEIAQRGISAASYAILRSIYTCDIMLTYAAMHELSKYPDYFRKANDLKILPNVAIEYLISISNNYAEMEVAAERYDPWPALQHIMARDDKFVFRYFNSHRAVVEKYIKQAIEYAKHNDLHAILKSLNGFKNSRFSQIYDFNAMKINETFKTFEQRKAHLKY
ncbi:hypothetical protein F-VV10_0167 [Faustovirus]|nr:hypothetical protein F-VV10_0167 [Faustovirus]